jgi:hypothetical protein
MNERTHTHTKKSYVDMNRMGDRMGLGRSYSTLAWAGSRIILIDILRMDGLGTTKDSEQASNEMIICSSYEE